MDMKKIHSGKLRAIGYDAARRLLRVELEGGAALEYSGVSADLWRRFASSGVAWSFYRDNIEDEFPAIAGARVAGSAGAQRAALDALFGGGSASAPDSSAADDGDASSQPQADGSAPR